MKTCKQINGDASSSTLVEDLVSNHNEVKAYKEMTFESLKNNKNIEFLLSKAPPKCRVLQKISVLFIIKYVLSGHALSVLEHI
jgi:hypothetical protein